MPVIGKEGLVLEDTSFLKYGKVWDAEAAKNLCLYLENKNHYEEVEAMKEGSEKDEAKTKLAKAMEDESQLIDLIKGGIETLEVS